MRNTTDACKEAGQKEPSFEFKHGREFSVTFFSAVAITESDTDRDTAKDPDRDTINDTQRQILTLLASNPRMTAREMATELGINERNTKKNIKVLRNAGLLARIGAARGGHWEVK
jgi:ATP-dependent DNA helicase RecG